VSRIQGFVGGSSPARSSFVDAQRSVNVFPVSGSGQRPALFGTPGTVVYISGLDAPIRAQFSQDGRSFCIGGGVFYEILSTGVAINRGFVFADTSIASISSNGTGGHQLFLVVSGHGYVYDLVTNTLTAIASAAFPVAATSGTFSDGYSIVLVTDSNQIQVSSLFDSLTWAGLDVAQRQSASDRITAIVVDHLELWMFGTKATEVWYNAGTANFPYQRVQGGYIEQGALAGSVAKFDNTIVWISQNDRGGGIAYRANGYNPQRISTDDVDATWRAYGDISDVESYTYEEEGHAFWIVSFPTAQRTWAYDAATQIWCERDWFNTTTGLYERVRARTHTFAFGKHLVGDRTLGIIYEQSLTALTDNGIPIRRRRRFPYLDAAGKQVYASTLTLDCETGNGLPADPTTEPQITLRWSDDRAKTWSNDLRAGLGFLGDYETIVDWNRLGKFRYRVFEIEVDDAVPIAWYAADLEFTVGNN
jgi:hypothetical protein